MTLSSLATEFSSARYWEARYIRGGNSGAGSYGRLAGYKSAVINGFIRSNRIPTVLDFGCGDGNLLSLLHPPCYTGVDISPTSVATCTARFAERSNHRFRLFDQLEPTDRADLALSIDVIYHLIEDSVFSRYLSALFSRAHKYVLIYASNTDASWPAAHVRHRRFSETVARDFPDWRLAAHLPNPHPYAPDQPDSTSFADFFIYAKASAGDTCSLTIPVPI